MRFELTAGGATVVIDPRNCDFSAHVEGDAVELN